MRKVELKSKKVLEVSPAPFSDAFKLFQAFAGELKGINLTKEYSSEMNIIKDLLAYLVTSPVIEERLWKCMERCKYGGLKLTPDLFEPVEAREDFVSVCMEVAVENLLPFTKDLYALCDQMLAVVASKSQK